MMTQRFRAILRLPIFCLVLALLAVSAGGCLIAHDDDAESGSSPLVEVDGTSVGEAEQELAYASVTFPVDDVAGKTWYHAGGSPYHRPHGGYTKANDQYCLDLNLSGDADAGKPVKAIRGGTVVQKDTSLGWVLIQSACNLTWNGQAYTTCFHGYMHMSGIPAAVAKNQAVNQGAVIGNVSNTGTTPNHLHFCHYVASSARVNDIAASTRNGFLESTDPATTLGGGFANLNLTTKVAVQYVDDQKSSGSFLFSKTGSGFTIDNTYGILDGMTYRASLVSGSDMATYAFNLGVPTTGDYGLWAFVPRNHGTATTTYKVYVNNVLKGTYSINQNSYSDQFVSVLGYGSSQCGVSANYGLTLNITAGSTVKVEVPAATGVSGKEVAFDGIYLVRKYADCNNVNK